MIAFETALRLLCKNLTKEKKDGSVKKMTDTGKEMTKVDVDVKMPKMENKKKV